MLSGRVWTHVTASRWLKCCANSRASARDCLRRRAAAVRRPTPVAEAAAPAQVDPSNTPIATTRSASPTSTSNVCRHTATRKRPCKLFLLLIIIIIIIIIILHFIFVGRKIRHLYLNIIEIDSYSFLPFRTKSHTSFLSFLVVNFSFFIHVGTFNIIYIYIYRSAVNLLLLLLLIFFFFETLNLFEGH